jgi:predicted nucleic acid-binding protein
MSSLTAIIDSSALISLLNVADPLNKEALAINEVLLTGNWAVLLPGEVFAETLNVVGKKLGRNDATLVGRTIIERHAAGEVRFIHAEPDVYAKALDLQASGRGGPSFVDTLVMAQANVHDTRYVFGFDATFRKNGYRLPGESATTTRAA